MDERTLTALKGSIAHWEGIKAGTDVDGGGKCPLCRVFARGVTITDNCAGCPVSEATGQQGCEGTPYYDFTGTYDETLGGETAKTDEQRAAAQAELDFLRSLLPPEEGV